MLTSSYQADSIPTEGQIYRRLYLENDLTFYSKIHFFSKWVSEEKKNKELIQRIIQEKNPDIVFIWGMYGLSRTIPAYIEHLLPNQTVYYISDLWPINPSLHEMFWNDPARTKLRRIAKRLLSFWAWGILKTYRYPPRLQFNHVIFVSKAVETLLIKAGLSFKNSTIIYSGRNSSKFFCQRDYSQFRDETHPVRLLYAGKLGHHKGVHTALEALSLLHAKSGERNIKFTIVGDGHPIYQEELEQLVNKHNLGNLVTFYGKVPHQKMTEVLHQNDILLVPSICEDALPGIIQEAMLAGLIIIGSRRGGIPEMVFHNQTGLIFEAENSKDLATQVNQLLSNREYAVQLGKRGQAFALKEFTSATMINNIESYLHQDQFSKYFGDSTKHV